MDQTAETAAKPAYKRILLKLSGEALMGEVHGEEIPHAANRN